MELDGLTRPAQLGRALAEETGEPGWLSLQPRLIAGGMSNLTFELESPAGSLILRRPPTGPLLPKAHDMGREARVQRALWGTAVPVPRIVLESDRSGLLGVPFYVMEKVDGVILKDSLPREFATTRADKELLTSALVDSLIALHAIDPASVGLADYGRHEGFMERQVHTWTRQWRASDPPNLRSMDRLVYLLESHTWAVRGGPSIVHGDFRLDNCVFDRADPSKVNAVLDWELSTIGDPLADLAMLLTYWAEVGDWTHHVVPSLTAQTDFPRRDDIIDRYARFTGREMGDLSAYRAFTHLKLAGILQGIAARVAGGQMAGQQFGDLDEEIRQIVERGVALAEASE